MTRKEAAELLLKFIAVIFFFIALNSAPNFLYLLNSSSFLSQIPEDQKASIYFRLISSVLFPLCTSILIWFTSGFFSEKLFSDSANQITSSGLSKNDFSALIFSSIGIYIFIMSLSDLARILFDHMIKSKELEELGNFPSIPFSSHTTGELISLCLQLILSFMLILGARSLTGILKNIENAGNETKNL